MVGVLGSEQVVCVRRSEYVVRMCVCVGVCVRIRMWRVRVRVCDVCMARLGRASSRILWNRKSISGNAGLTRPICPGFLFCCGAAIFCRCGKKPCDEELPCLFIIMCSCSDVQNSRGEFEPATA